MTEQPDEQKVEIYGEYHPEAAHYGSYNESMAAWRNQVRSMQQAGSLPGEPSPQEPAQIAPVTDTFSGTPSPEAPSEPEAAEEAEAEVVIEGGEYEAPAPVQVTPGAAEQDDGYDRSDQSEEKQYFDPTEHNAIEVMSYLEGVGEAEAKRVLEVEENGDRPRKGIVGQRDAILKRARRNDMKKAEAVSSSE